MDKRKENKMNTFDIMENLTEISEFGIDTFEKMNEMGLDPISKLAVICSFMDYLALEFGMETKELLEFLIPIVEDVNNVFPLK